MTPPNADPRVPAPLPPARSHPTPASLSAAPVPVGVGGVGNPNAAFDVMALLTAFRRRWPLALTLGIVCAAIATSAAWKFIPSAKYTARTSLEVAPTRPSILFNLKESEPNFRIYQQTQIAHLKSFKVLDSALSKPEIAELPTVRSIRARGDDPIEWLEQELKVSAASQSMVVQLSLSGSRPKDLAELLNAVTNSYLELVVNREHNARRQRLRDLEQLYKQMTDDLDTKRQGLRELAEAMGSSDADTLSMMQQFELSNAQQTQQLRSSLHFEILKTETELKLLEPRAVEEQAALSAWRASGPGNAMQDYSGDPEVARLQQQIQELTRHHESARSKFRKASDPALARLRLQIANAQQDLEQRLAQLRELSTRPGTALANGGSELGSGSAMAQLARLKESLAMLKSYDETLARQAQQYETNARSQPSSMIDLKTKHEEVNLAAAVAKEVGMEVEALKVELRADQRVQLLDKARPPGTKDEMKKVKLTGVAGLGAFGLAILGVTFLEYQARRIGTVEEVVQTVGLRLVGAVPHLVPTRSSRSKPQDEANDLKKQSQLVESVDTMRTMLLHASRAESIRTVMVASAMKGEGKTSLTSHLAISLARAGRKTLMVDCDLRMPTLHRLFDVPRCPGVCELLREEVDLRSVIQPTGSENLHIISAGQTDPLAMQLLAQDRARSLFDTLLNDYDFLLVDSAPILLVTDTLLLSQQVDAVLFSILRDVSCVPQVQAAYGRLSDLGVRVLGAVVNGAPNPAHGYRGYYTYGESHVSS